VFTQERFLAKEAVEASSFVPIGAGGLERGETAQQTETNGSSVRRCEAHCIRVTHLAGQALPNTRAPSLAYLCGGRRESEVITKA
jgi:hypothetical protein